jgi:endonuclease III
MRSSEVPKAIKILKKEVARFKTPYVTEVSEAKDPYKVLVSCILSLRTKDSMTREASTRLFKLASTPDKMSGLKKGTIEKAIYGVGFYRVKSGVIKDISLRLVEDYGSKVPDTIEELLTLKGVGRKTANLVVTMGFGKPGICVDTHVHRIVNRWGFVSTKTPLETEFALRRKLQKRYWIIINDLLVTFGQNVCKPISPFCSSCKIFKYCERVGVAKHR